MHALDVCARVVVVGGLLVEQAAEHVLKDATVAEVSCLRRGVDAYYRSELARVASIRVHGDRYLVGDVFGTEKVSSPVRPRLSAVSPGWNCNGNTPMPMRFERWIRS